MKLSPYFFVALSLIAFVAVMLVCFYSIAVWVEG
jgi:hypothetical protein